MNVCQYLEKLCYGNFYLTVSLFFMSTISKKTRVWKVIRREKEMVNGCQVGVRIYDIYG